LWLQGGPGASSLFGLFTENGPFAVNSKFYLKRRKFSWTKTYSVIYIDNPVGTGNMYSQAFFCCKLSKTELRCSKAENIMGRY
jgi:vitellogenic carboxypeptidase-like protein